MPNKTLASPFGNQVKKALIDNRMTQRDLASKIGVSNKYLWLILYGYRPNSKYNEMIIDTLGLNHEGRRKEV